MIIKRLAALAFVGAALLTGAAACGDDEDALEGMRTGLVEQGVSEDDAECVTDYVRDNVDDIADKIVEDNEDPEVTAALQEGMADCGLTGGGEEEVVEEEE